MMESPLKNIKEQVTCSICLDTFTDPKTITCLHTFCCECLKKHALISQRNGKFLCPECQAEVDLPEANRFEKLPTSFHHSSLLSVLTIRQSGKGNDISCGICKKKSAEISYCFECAKFMCSDCVNAHQLFSHFTEGHKVTPVKRFQAEDYEALMKRKSLCSQQNHEGEVTRFFCHKCKLCVCQICIATDHKAHEGHDVELLDKVADCEKTNILMRTEILKEKIKVFSDAICKYEQTVSELETNIANAKREVSQTAEQMIAKIREHERHIISTLDNTRESRADKLNSAQARVQSLLKQFNQALKFAENLIQRSSSSDVMHSKNDLEQRFEHLNNTPIPKLPVNSFVKFFPAEGGNLTLGCLTTSEPVVRVNKDFQAGVETEFEVNPGIHELQVCEMKVVVEPGDKVGSLITCEKEGILLAKLTPEFPGTLQISVQINGKTAASPYTVHVKRRLIHLVKELRLKEETFQSPHGIAVNSEGLIAVADQEKHRILIIDMEGNCVRKVGCYGKSVGQLNRPTDVTYVNDDNILVADQLNHRIQQFNVQTGNFVKSFGKKGTRDGEFQNPVSVCVDDVGRVVVADGLNSTVQVLSQDGEPLFKLKDSGPEKLDRPVACIYHQNKYIVSDWGNDCVKVYNKSGKCLYKIENQGKGDGQLCGPWGLCVQKCGNYYNLIVCNAGNGRVDQFTLEGSFTGKTVQKLQRPAAITATSDGYIFVSDCKANKIHILK